MKILVVAMTMNSGGAETHIYELMRELHRRGFKLMLVSSGGMLSEKIRSEFSDIIVKTTSLDKISFLLFASFIKLLNEIIAFKPHLIHTHGRIPSTICGILAAILHIPHVATAHGCYRMFFGVKLLSLWGQNTIAVSDDIKSYLQKNYSLKNENIIIQKNGIDTQKFFQLNIDEKALLKSQVLASLDLYDDKRIYLTVSRLSHDAYLCIDELLEVANTIANADDSAILLIAGDGELMSVISQKVAQVNFNLQKDFAILLGHRDDVDILVKVADVFIGNGRSAIEAAACGCPIIVAGGGAYLGRVNKHNLDECVATNFTARNRTSFDLALMLKEITSTKRGGFEAVLAEFIKIHYSIKATTDDTLNAYNAAMRKKGRVKCFVFGYYGCGNFGDDMLLWAMEQNLREHMPYLRITATAGKYAANDIQDIKTINRYNIIAILNAIKSSKVCILGAGELLQDSTSNRSFLYYYILLRISTIFKKRIVLYANGIGKIENKINRKKIKKLQNKFDLVLVRDKASQEHLLQLLPDIDKNKIYLTADECLSFKLNINGVKLKNKLLIFSKDIQNADTKLIIENINRFIKNFKLIPVIVTADTIKDLELCKQISSLLNNTQIIKAHNLNGFYAIMSESVLAVSSRLHGLIFSSMAGVVPVALTDEQKLIEFMTAIGQDDLIVQTSELSSDKIYLSLAEAFISRFERKEKIASYIENMSVLSKDNARLTAALIMGKDEYKD